MRRRCGRGSERQRIVEVGDGGAGVVGAVAVCPLDLCAVVGPQQILELGSGSRSGCGLRRRSGAGGVVRASGSWRLATRRRIGHPVFFQRPALRRAFYFTASINSISRLSRSLVKKRTPCFQRPALRWALCFWELTTAQGDWFSSAARRRAAGFGA